LQHSRYTDVYGNTHGWRGNRTAATQVLLQPIQGITRQKWTVGSFRPALAPSGERQGFLLKGTAMTPITMAGCLEVEPHAVNEAGEVVGSCGGGDAWHWKDGVVTFLAPPDDPIDNCEGFGFEATGINKAGVIVGSCADSGFINNHGVVTVLEVWLENGSPGYTYPKGINDKGTIFGTACDVDNPCYGLLIKQGVTSFVSYPGAPHTEITAVHPTNGRIWGNWQDSAGVWHAFTATPGTAPALMSEEVATR
jgi:hypothetical protein